MKIRKGFVSNSSNSSFILDTRNLTQEQIQKVLDIPLRNVEDNSDWRVWEKGYNILGEACIMDNLEIEEFFEKLDISRDYYKIDY